MIVAFAATFFFGVNVVYIILAAALVGIIVSVYKQYKGKKQA